MKTRYIDFQKIISNSFSVPSNPTEPGQIPQPPQPGFEKVLIDAVKK